MSQFNYDQYQQVVARANNPTTTAPKIGYLKLADGQEALVRINVSKLDDLKFATVHTPAFGKKFEGLGSGFTPVMCLNEVGSYSDACPFCKAAAEGHEVISKAAKKVYVQMLIAYKDATTGQFSVAQPVVWERPAGFSKELATKLRDYGDLSAHVFKLTRMGSGKDTRYALDYIPLYDKPDFVPMDFSAFNNFEVSKHSFWVKTAADLETYLATGAFKADEQPVQATATAAANQQYYGQADAARPNTATVQETPTMQQPVQQPTVQPTQQPAQQQSTTTERPVRNFSGFSF